MAPDKTNREIALIQFICICLQVSLIKVLKKGWL
jgi:hypothetical protein